MNVTECVQRINASLNKLTRDTPSYMARNVYQIVAYLDKAGIRGVRLAGAPKNPDCPACLIYEYLRADSGVPWNQFKVHALGVSIYSEDLVSRLPPNEHPAHHLDLDGEIADQVDLPFVLLDLVERFDRGRFDHLAVCVI